MRILRLIQQWLLRLWDLSPISPTGIDSHKWESKIEILGSLSRTYR